MVYRRRKGPRKRTLMQHERLSRPRRLTSWCVAIAFLGRACVCMHAYAHHRCCYCPQYVNYYPKDKKYVSLFPNKNKDDPKMLKQYVASWQLRAVATLPARNGTPCAPDVRTCEPSAGTAQQRTHGVSCPTTTCLATSVGGTPTRSTRAASQTQ